MDGAPILRAVSGANAPARCGAALQCPAFFVSCPVREPTLGNGFPVCATPDPTSKKKAGPRGPAIKCALEGKRIPIPSAFPSEPSDPCMGGRSELFGCSPVKTQWQNRGCIYVIAITESHLFNTFCLFDEMGCVSIDNNNENAPFWISVEGVFLLFMFRAMSLECESNCRAKGGWLWQSQPSAG